jgi:hypothetical protein
MLVSVNGRRFEADAKGKANKGGEAENKEDA